MSKGKLVMGAAMATLFFAACTEAPKQEEPAVVTPTVEEVVAEQATTMGLQYVEPGAKQVITYEEVNAAQQAWCDALVQIGKLHTEGGDYRAYAEQVLTDAYNYDNGKVFFKPTLASGPQTFRNTKKGALAYFVGGDEEYPDDKGFAITPWVSARFDNAGDGNEGIQIYGSTAITMGNVWVTDAKGNTVMVDKTWVFRKGEDGKLRIIVHKSSLPFDPSPKK
jgi:hypothetical protein